MQGCIANGNSKECKSAQSLICEKDVWLRHFYLLTKQHFTQWTQNVSTEIGESW